MECNGVNLNRRENQNLICNAMYVTYLKVGRVNIKQEEPIPFVVEWIPNFLRASNFGELKLSFQFGHHAIE